MKSIAAPHATIFHNILQPLIGVLLSGVCWITIRACNGREKMLFSGCWPQGFWADGLKRRATGGVDGDAMRHQGMDVLVNRR
jgi:hypothetical protein